MKYKNQIENIARAIIVKNDQLLLCKMKKADWYFLPGGHIEFSESAKNTLLRELNEEIGISSAKVNCLAGIAENQYFNGKFTQHEINFFFDTDINNEESIKSQENHLEFDLVPISNLESIDLKPENAKQSIINYLNNKQNFWIPLP